MSNFELVATIIRDGEWLPEQEAFQYNQGIVRRVWKDNESFSLELCDEQGVIVGVANSELCLFFASQSSLKMNKKVNQERKERKEEEQ